MFYFGTTSLHSMPNISQWSLSQTLPFLLKPPWRSPLYLVVHVLDDEEHGAVEGGRFAVQRLQAGAVLQRAVGQAPRVALHPRGQAPGQLGREQGMREMVTPATHALPQPILSLTLGSDSTTSKKETWGFPSHTCSMCMFSRRALWCFRIGRVSSSSSSS